MPTSNDAFCGLVSALSDTLPLTPPYDAILFSDPHLGSNYCDRKKLLKFLATTARLSGKLICVGDLVDRKDARFTDEDWEVFCDLHRHSGFQWIEGNHDAGAEHIAACQFNTFMLRKTVIVSHGVRIMAVHGHEWDRWVEDNSRLARWLNHLYMAVWHVHASLGAWLKRRSKIMVKCAAAVEAGVKGALDDGEADLFICGHTHLAGTFLDGKYLNLGCWTEEGQAHYAVIKGGRVELRPFG